MKNALTATLLILVGAAASFAHHSIAAEFDDKKPVSIKGAVVRYEWMNPHVLVHVDPFDGSAGWTVELESPLDIKPAGWTKDTLKVGDSVTVDAIQARDGSRLAFAKSFTLPGGKKLSAPLSTAIVAAPKVDHSKPAPKTPDGHPRFGPEPGQKGYWAYPSQVSLVDKNAGTIRMNRDGLLANINDAPKVAPFQPWAQGLYIYRQQQLLRDDPMASCLPPGGPRQMMVPYGVQVIDDPARQRVFFMSAGANRNWRLVYLDGRKNPPVDDITPMYWGNASGKWEGDTLVSETDGFNDRFWFSNGGLPHTEFLKLTERFSRPDYNTLRYEVTVDDPGAYTKPWTSALTLQWVAGVEPEEYFCEDQNRDPQHLTTEIKK